MLPPGSRHHGMSRNATHPVAPAHRMHVFSSNRACRQAGSEETFQRCKFGPYYSAALSPELNILGLCFGSVVTLIESSTELLRDLGPKEET